MAQQNSFDIVSEVDSAEIANALNQTLKEVRQRFDFKGSSANVVHEKNELVLSAEDGKAAQHERHPATKTQSDAASR